MACFSSYFYCVFSTTPVTFLSLNPNVGTSGHHRQKRHAGTEREPSLARSGPDMQRTPKSVPPRPVFLLSTFYFLLSAFPLSELALAIVALPRDKPCATSALN